MEEKIFLTCDAKLWKRPRDMKDMLLLGEYNNGIFFTYRKFPVDEALVEFLSRYDKVELNFEKRIK